MSSGRARQMMNIITGRLGKLKMTTKTYQKLKRSVPNRNIVMGRAHRGLYAGSHIQFGNQISKVGGNKSRTCWKPNIHQKRLFSYILDRHIRVKVSMHALRLIDHYGGIDEYLLKTPYNKMDTELGLLWKARVEKMYQELAELDIAFFAPEDEAKLEESFKQMRLSEKAARKEFRRALSGGPRKENQIKEGSTDKSGQDKDGDSGENDQEGPVSADA